MTVHRHWSQAIAPECAVTRDRILAAVKAYFASQAKRAPELQRTSGIFEEDMAAAIAAADNIATQEK